MADSKKEKEAKEKYLELKMIEQKLQALQQQAEQVNQQVHDVEETIDNLSMLKEVKQGTEMYVPVASGIFLPAQAGKVNELLVNVGNNVVVGKSVQESQDLLKEQLDEMEKLKKEMNAQLEHLVIRAQQLQQELQKLVK